MAKKNVTVTIDVCLWESARRKGLNLSKFFNSSLKEKLEAEGEKREVKAVIVAAGKSTRLYPLTLNTPKCLLKIGDKALLDHLLDRLEKAGINKITIVTGFQEAQIRKHIKNRKNIKCTYNPFFSTTNILASLWFAREDLDTECIFTYSDVLYTQKTFDALLKKKEDIVAVVAKCHVDHESEKVKEKNGKIIAISKDIPESEASGEFIGLMKFSREGARQLKKVLEEIACEDTFPEHYFTVAIERLLQKGIDVHVSYASGPWIEIDYPNELERTRKEIWPAIKELDLRK